jgi:hypothetical protein
MEHPTGDFASAKEAMGDAIARLRGLLEWPGSIVFCAQGYGGKPDTYQFAEVRLDKHSLSVDQGPLDLVDIRAAAKVSATAIVPVGSEYSIAGANVSLVPAEGFEPPTYGLQNRCTTTVLSRHINE